MNNIKSGLIEAAGDLTNSKKRVMASVEQDKRKKPNKRPSFVPLAITVILLLAVSLFFNQWVKQQSALKMTDAEIVEMYQAEQQAFLGNVENAKHEAIDQYMNDTALIAYGEAEGITVTAAQKKEVASTYLDSIVEELRTPIEKNLKEKGYTWQGYEVFVEQHKGTVHTIKKQLLASYTAKYSDFSDNILNTLMELDANQFFQQTFPEKAAEMEKSYDYAFTFARSNGGLQWGAILAVEEHAILFMPGFINENSYTDYQQQKEDATYQAFWIPKQDDWQVQVGDPVQMSISITYWTSEPQGFYNPSAIGENLVVIQDKTVQFEIQDAKAITQWLGTINWTTEKIQFATEPQYRFDLGDATYNAWVSADGQSLELYEPFSSQYAEVHVDKLSIWTEMLAR